MSGRAIVSDLLSRTTFPAKVVGLLLAVLAIAACDRRLAPREIAFALQSGGHCAVLVGGVHAAPASFAKPGYGLKRLFRQADVFALEIDQDMLVGAVRAAYATHDPAEQFQSLPPPLQEQALRALETVRQMRPGDREQLMKLHLAAVIRTLQASNTFTYEPPLSPSLDSWFFVEAKAAGKKIEEVEGLEAWIASERSTPRPVLERQIALFAAIALDADVATKAKALVARTFALMDTGDLEAIYRLHRQVFEEELGVPGYTAHLIDARNAHMADRMAQLLSEYTNTFAIIGALHLPGPEGVIARLQRRGVTAVRINSADEAPPCRPAPK
jgi:uncharacterized protein